MARSLSVFLNENLVGRLIQNRDGQMQFKYLPEWLAHPNAAPLSLSLPLQTQGFSAKRCGGFFSGLLPESDVRKLVAKNLHVSANNDVSLLERIGGDCAGAVTFLPEGDIPQNHPENYERLSSQKLLEVIEEKLPLQPLLAGDGRARLSLAGVQSKLAVSVAGKTIFLPLQGTPSTHILKPGNARFRNLVYNEAFCMALAEKMGLPVPKCEMRYAGKTPYLLIERYDRETIGSPPRLKRLHQEDFCQAMGIRSEMKYQSEGGPSLKHCFALVRNHSAVAAFDLQRLLHAVIFNVLIGNNDAHGKNFSFLYSGDLHRVQLAPFYDLVSTLFYPNLSTQMAMSIGGEYDANGVSLPHFEKLAMDVGLSKAIVRQEVRSFTVRLQAVAASLKNPNLGISELKSLIQARCQQMLQV